jgi:hypothetical protein
MWHHLPLSLGQAAWLGIGTAWSPSFARRGTNPSRLICRATTGMPVSPPMRTPSPAPSGNEATLFSSLSRLRASRPPSRARVRLRG